MASFKGRRGRKKRVTLFASGGERGHVRRSCSLQSALKDKLCVLLVIRTTEFPSVCVCVIMHVCKRLYVHRDNVCSKARVGFERVGLSSVVR